MFGDVPRGVANSVVANLITLERKNRLDLYTIREEAKITNYYISYI